jgi:antitoxin component YwqK of YwqJK toxin-antitoxin module
MRQILIEKYIEPSEIKCFKHYIEGDITIKRWLDINYNLHSFMGQPAYIRYENGKIEMQEWYKKGVRHRDKNLPSVISYKKGRVSTQSRYKNGEFLGSRWGTFYSEH